MKTVIPLRSRDCSRSSHPVWRASRPVRAEIIDRMLAVVDGQIVTLSDVRAALRFGLVPADVTTDPIAAALQRLIDRRLMLHEVERYAPPEPGRGGSRRRPGGACSAASRTPSPSKSP